MSLWSSLRGIFHKSSGYVLVWRERNPEGSAMLGEPIDAQSDVEAVSVVKPKFGFTKANWVFWVLFRPDDTEVKAEPGPRFSKWPGELAAVGSDNHVQSTLRDVRRTRKPVSHMLRKVKLKSPMPKKRD